MYIHTGKETQNSHMLYVTKSSIQVHSVISMHISNAFHWLFADRPLSVAGPNLWNVLPENLRDCNCLAVFKKNLKTYWICRGFKL